MSADPNLPPSSRYSRYFGEERAGAVVGEKVLSGRIAVRCRRPGGSFVAISAPTETFAEFAQDIRQRWPDTVDVRELVGAVSHDAGSDLSSEKSRRRAHPSGYVSGKLQG